MSEQQPVKPRTRQEQELRDWFAGQALNGALAAGLIGSEIQRQVAVQGGDMNAAVDAAIAEVANASYRIADAMLKVRGEQ